MKHKPRYELAMAPPMNLSPMNVYIASICSKEDRSFISFISQIYSREVSVGNDSLSS